MTTEATTKPAPGTPEYDAAMAAKAETGGVTASHTDATGTSTNVDGSPPPAATPPKDEKPARPDHIPEKFWDAEKGEPKYEAMAKAYTELEKKLGQPKDEKAPNEGKPGEGDAPAPLAEIGERATQELAETGALSDEVYQAYEKAGISRKQVDTYVAGVRAQGELIVRQVTDEFGGKEQYAAVQDWANTALSEAEQAAFNNAVFGADEAVRMMAVKGLRARFEAENGHTGNLVKPRASAEALTGDVFRSRKEMTDAMADARYKRDPAYRSDVERKVANSASAGIDLW